MVTGIITKHVAIVVTPNARGTSLRLKLSDYSLIWIVVSIACGSSAPGEGAGQATKLHLKKTGKTPLDGAGGDSYNT